MKGFNLQEFNIFLHFNSISLTETDLGATLNCCPWLWWCQGGSRAGFAWRQRGTELNSALVRGTEINYGKICALKTLLCAFETLLMPYCRALASPGQKDIKDDAAMGMHRRHQRANFCLYNWICKSPGNGLGDTGSDRDHARWGHSTHLLRNQPFPNSSQKKWTFVLGFVSLIQTFHVGEDLPAAKEKNNLLSLF